MRILIADDQGCVRYALRRLLLQQPGLEVVGEAADSQELLAQTHGSAPDLILLDWELPGLAGMGGLSALRRTAHAVRVIVLSGRPGARRAAQAAGADAFVSKGDPPERLLATLRWAAAR